jgi:hypothetical protein
VEGSKALLQIGEVVRDANYSFPLHYLSLFLSFSYSIISTIFINCDVKSNNYNNVNNENNAGIFEWHLLPDCYVPPTSLI